ncbi:hypothetical protein EA135_08285, partial [Proteus mirabilis]
NSNQLQFNCFLKKIINFCLNCFDFFYESMKNSSIINKKTESSETNSVFILHLTGYLIYFDFFK